jgi:hypothetical protein
MTTEQTSRAEGDSKAMKCRDCGETAKTYYDPEFYDVKEGGWVTDCRHWRLRL